MNRVGKSMLREDGFTIVELMVALVVLAVGLLPLFSMMGQGMSGINRGKVNTIATQIAQEQVEKIRMMTYNNIGLTGGNPPGTISPYESVTKSGVDFTIQRSVDWVDDPDDGLGAADPNSKDYKRFEVVVRWTDPAPAGTTRMGTYVKPYTSNNHSPIAHAPVVTPSYPPGAGGYIRDGVTLMAQASDDDGTISEVQFLYKLDGGGAWTIIGSTGTKVGDYYEYSWDSSALNGTYLVMAKAWDDVGDVDSTYASVIIDNLYPTASILPPSGPVTSAASPIAIVGNAYDNITSSFSYYYLEHDSATVPASWQHIDCTYAAHPGFEHRPPTVSGIHNDVLAGWDMGALADGTYQVRLHVFDKVEHETVTTQALTLSIPPPVPVLTGVIGGGNISLSWDADTLDGAPYSFPADFTTFELWKQPADGANWSKVSIPDPYTLTELTLTHDAWKYRVVAVDGMGNASTSNAAP